MMGSHTVCVLLATVLIDLHSMQNTCYGYIKYLFGAMMNIQL